MLNMTWEFKLKPTPEQITEIERILVVCRKVWNYNLAERKDWINYKVMGEEILIISCRFHY
jgi:putative transposase